MGIKPQSDPEAWRLEIHVILLLPYRRVGTYLTLGRRYSLNES